MKNLLLALAVAFGIAVVATMHAAPGPMQTVNSLSELSLIPNPLTVASNTFVVTEGTIGDGTSSIWTFVRGATNTPDADHIVSSTMPAAGRFIRNTPSGGGNVTNIYNTVVSTNLYITTNVYIMQGSFTNQAGLWELTNNIMENVNKTYASILRYTNTATSVNFEVVNGTGNNTAIIAGVGVGTLQTTEPELLFGANGKTIELSSGDNSFIGSVPGQISMGRAGTPWKGVYSTNGVYDYGSLSGTNYSRFAYHATTNGIGVLDFQNAGTGAALDHFSFRSNGTEVATITASGAVNGWTLTGGTNLSTAATVSAPDILTSALAVNRAVLSMVGTNLTVDFGTTNRYVSCTLTGTVVNVLFTNVTAGKWFNVLLSMPTNNVTPTFPMAAGTKNWFGGAPSTFTANTVGSLSFYPIDTTTNNTLAAYAETQ